MMASPAKDIWAAIFLAASHLGIPKATAHKWRSRGFVPAEQQNKIVKAMVDKGFLFGHDALDLQREKARNKNA